MEQHIGMGYVTAIPIYILHFASLHLSHNLTRTHTALLSDGISATCLPHSAGPVQPQPSPVVKQLQSHPTWQPPSVETLPSVWWQTCVVRHWWLAEKVHYTLDHHSMCEDHMWGRAWKTCERQKTRKNTAHPPPTKPPHTPSTKITRQTTKYTHTHTYTHTQRQDTRCPALRTGAVG